MDDFSMNDFWYRIGDIFARKAQAVGSLLWNKQTLGWYSVDGTYMNEVDLTDGLATEAEAAHSLTNTQGTTSLSLDAVNGSNLSTLDLADMLDSRYAASLDTNAYNDIILKNKDGTALTTLRGFAVADECFSQASISSPAAGTIRIDFMNKSGQSIDYVQFTVPH
jgi:hypothetical protein